MSNRRSSNLGRTLAAACIAALALPARAQDATVTTTDDVVDFGGAQQVADLPGPDGLVSFREACTAVNNTPGPQTIAFAIPNTAANEWSGGIAVLFMNFNVFPLTDDETTVDFSTQTAFTGDTNPNGNEVGIRTAPITAAPAILVTGDRCTIRGLDRVLYCGYAIELMGNQNRVVGNTITGPLYGAVYITGGFNGPPATGNVVGGTDPADANFLSSGNDGVRIDAPAEDNLVIGNTLTGVYHGVAVRGSQYTTTADNNRIGGPTPAERNLIAGAGKYGEEGFPTGAQVHLEYASGTIIEGNYIGTTADGTAPSPGQRGPVGVEVVDSSDTIVRDNVISGIRVVGVNHYAGQVFGQGVSVTAINRDTDDTLIEDNRIGTDPSGLLPVPNLNGVQVEPFLLSKKIVGTVVRANTIALNERTGARVYFTVADARITRNSIRDNGLLGIDLLASSGGTGVTLNDPQDPDSGGNGLQNFPVLAAASLEGAAVRVTGTLNSTPLSDFTLEFFASPACDPSGFGEGRDFLGSVAVSTDASGNAAFDALLASTAPSGWFVTATATAEPLGATSEFCACVQLTGSGLASYCTPGTSAAGCQALMSASGVASASASSGFALVASSVEGQRDGTFFFGSNGRQANPWGNGTSYQCVVPPLSRTGLLTGSGTVGLCDGSMSQDLCALWSAKPIKNPGAGATVQAQLWYRDPQSTSNQTTSLSDAIEFTVAP